MSKINDLYSELKRELVQQRGRIAAAAFFNDAAVFLLSEAKQESKTRLMEQRGDE